MPTPARKTRADAERNRVRVLDSAMTMTAEHGDDLQMADVARAAGVGIGTVYRHFPTRQALFAAAAERRFAEILGFGETECLPMADPRAGLRRFLEHIGEVHESGRALSSGIEAALGDTAPRGEVGDRLRELGEAFLRRGTAAGVFRVDATAADLYLIVGALAAVSRHAFGDWRRFIELALDGLRPQSLRHTEDPA